MVNSRGKDAVKQTNKAAVICCSMADLIKEKDIHVLREKNVYFIQLKKLGCNKPYCCTVCVSINEGKYNLLLLTIRWNSPC